MESHVSAEPIVFDMEVHDLSPQKDPKGGSPRTPPGGIPVREIPVYEVPQQESDGFHKFTPIIISVLCTALIGMTVAWWTALQERGVSRKEMEEYVKNYSPYVMDKTGINEHQTSQDKEIGRISGVQQSVLQRLDKLETGRP